MEGLSPSYSLYIEVEIPGIEVTDLWIISKRSLNLNSDVEANFKRKVQRGKMEPIQLKKSKNLKTRG